MSENSVKQRVISTAGKLDMLSAMSMNRAERRRLAKAAGVAKILGSSKPFLKKTAV